jgi:hypothetical protein
MAALIYLRLHLLKNGLLSLVSSPKRLIVTLFFLLWVGASFASVAMTRFMGPHGAVPVPALPVDQVRLGLIVLLIVFTLGSIERGFEGAVFSFPAADYDFLFPTPIPRRLIVAFRVGLDALVMLADVGIVVVFLTPLAMGLVMREASVGRMVLVWIAAGLYMLFAVNLARIIELLLTNVQAILGISKGVVRVAVWVFGVALLWGGGYVVFGEESGPAAVMAVLSHPPYSYLLTPLLAVAAFVTGEGHPLLASPVASMSLLLLLAAVCTVGVCVLDRDVAEATLEHSARVARMRAAARSQDIERMTGESLREGSSNHRSLILRWREPSLALPYKLIAETLHGNRWQWGAWLLVMVGLAFLARLLSGDELLLRSLPGPAAAYVLLLSSSFQGLRFRSELTHITLLRTFPIAASRQLLGLTAPRALLHSALLLAGMLCFWLGHPLRGVHLSVAVACCLPLGSITSGLVGAVVSCIFPNSTDPGQRFLGGLLHTLGVGLALIPCLMLVAMGMAFALPGVLIGLLGNAGLLPVAFAIMFLGNWALGRFQPGED